MKDSPSSENIQESQPLSTKEKQARHAMIVASSVGIKTKKEMMILAGYSVSTAEKQTSRTRNRKSFNQLLDDILPDEEIVAQHESLLKSRRLDHMVFPLKVEDDEIGELLASVNCVLRKIVHSEQAKHAYFWSPDNRARKDALDMLYKIKGKYAPEKFEDVSPYKGLSTAELLERKKRAIDFFKKKS